MFKLTVFLSVYVLGVIFFSAIGVGANSEYKEIALYEPMAEAEQYAPVLGIPSTDVMIVHEGLTVGVHVKGNVDPEKLQALDALMETKHLERRTTK